MGIIGRLDGMGEMDGKDGRDGWIIRCMDGFYKLNGKDRTNRIRRLNE